MKRKTYINANVTENTTETADLPVEESKPEEEKEEKPMGFVKRHVKEFIAGVVGLGLGIAGTLLIAKDSEEDIPALEDLEDSTEDSPFEELDQK